MKPFDLEKAKAGAPLVTRDGRPAKFIAHETECQSPYNVLVLIAGAINQVNEIGANYQYSASNNDLFLADPPKVKKERWVAVVVNPYGEYTSYSALDKEKLHHQITFVGAKICGEIIHHTWEEEAV